LDWNKTKAKIQSQNRRSILAKIENTNMTTHSPDLKWCGHVSSNPAHARCTRYNIM